MSRLAPPASPMTPQSVPLRPGFSTAKKLSKMEQERLERHGWKPGEPIPQNISQLFDEADKIEREASDVATMPPPPGYVEGAPPLKIPEPVALESMPPDKQREVQASIAAAMEMAKQQQAVEQSIPVGAAPGVADAIRQAMTDAAADPTKPYVLPQEVPPPPPVEGPKACPRCNFDLTLEKDPIEVTDADKTQFLLSWFSQPFIKTYKLYGGKITIVLRTLTVAERMEITQATWSLVNAGKAKEWNSGPDQIYARMRTVLELVQLKTPNQDYVQDEGTLRTCKDDEPGGRMWQLCQRFEQGVPMNEMARTVLERTAVEFNVLVDKLGALSNSENF